MSTAPALTAKAVLALLAARHADDVFVPECKDGPTHGADFSRLDAWAMRKSWAHPCSIGYEVKVARSDWLRDQKWTGYRDLVNEFYIVAPDGVVNIMEIPEGVGYLRVAKTGTRLITARKAVWSAASAEAALTLAQYVLMSRVTIDGPAFDRRDRKAAYWAEWLAREEKYRQIGHACSAALQARYQRDVEDVRRNQQRAAEDREVVDAVLAATAALGLKWVNNGWRDDRRPAEHVAMDVALKVAGAVLPHHQRRSVREAAETLLALTAEEVPSGAVGAAAPTSRTEGSQE